MHVCIHVTCMENVRNPFMLHETCMYINIITCMSCSACNSMLFAWNMHAICTVFRVGMLLYVRILKHSIFLVMYSWLNAFFRVMNGKYSITLLCFGCNSQCTLLLRPCPSVILTASVITLETEKQ